MLRRLPEQLRSLHPDAVCVLVGWNDGWARPARLDPVALGNSGFPLRWRTGRLLALMTAQPDDTIASQASVPFLGAWHVGEQEFVFSADGNVQFGGQPATWVVQGDTIRITPKGGSEFWI